jgi:hypothetical protein
MKSVVDELKSEEFRKVLKAKRRFQKKSYTPLFRLLNKKIPVKREIIY